MKPSRILAGWLVWLLATAATAGAADADGDRFFRERIEPVEWQGTDGYFEIEVMPDRAEGRAVRKGSGVTEVFAQSCPVPALTTPLSAVAGWSGL